MEYRTPKEDRGWCQGVLEALDRFEAAVRADESKHDDSDGCGTIKTAEEIKAIEAELADSRDEMEALLSEIP